jgi:hypothetical protein
MAEPAEAPVPEASERLEEESDTKLVAIKRRHWFKG